MIYVVNGTPRSGTSLCMQLLEAAGIPVLDDKIKGPDIYNPRGYYECAFIQENPDWLSKAHGHAVKLMGPIQLPVKDTLVLLTERDQVEVATSWKNMNNLPGAAPTGEMAKNIRVMLKKNLEDRGYKWLSVSHRKLLIDPKPLLTEICNFLTLGDKVEKMATVIDQSLWRNRVVV